MDEAVSLPRLAAFFVSIDFNPPQNIFYLYINY